LLKKLTVHNDFTRAFEAVTFAGKRINNVYLDRRILPKVRDRSRRADVGEDEMIVVPNGNCALGREIGCSIGQTVATKASRCSTTTRFISAVSLAPI